MEKQLSIHSVEYCMAMQINELNYTQQCGLISETKYWTKKLDTKKE